MYRLYLLRIRQTIERLSKFARSLDSDSAIISTGPEVHVHYAKWAFEHGYHVLMDKPVHVEKDAAHDVNAARQIHAKFSELVLVLEKSRTKYPGLVCEVLTQRRFHPAYRLIKDTIDDIYNKTLCPITYYYAFHNDGQWRMPDEIVSIDYHGYNKGYGKASHSGYHFYDLLNWFTAGFREQKGVDSVLIKAWPNFPLNYLEQVNKDTLEKVFPDKKFKTNLATNGELRLYGEIDVMSTVRLLSSKNVITHAQIDLQHSGISARSWPSIDDRNLYKGNGRVRHEQHYINMGPFVSISLTSWQSKPFESERIDSKDIYKPGHEFNLDITICRNSKLVGGKAAETFTLKDIYKPVLNDYSRGHQEDARRSAIVEFFDLIQNGKNRGSSSLQSHALSSLLMSGVYESIATGQEVINKVKEEA